MNKLFKIVNKAKWLVGGNFIFAFSQWIILILISHLNNKENLGQYSLALSIVAPIYAITKLQLRPLYVLNVNNDSNPDYNDYYFIRILSSFLAFFLCLVVGSYFDVLISILTLVSFLKFLESYSDIIYAYYNAFDKTELISKSLTLKGLGSIAVVGLALYFFNFFTALTAFSIVYLIVLLFVDNNYLIKDNILKFKTIDFSILKIAIPMGFSLGMVTLQSSLSQLFLSKYSSIESVGIFTVLSYFIIIGSIFINSICQYLSPHLARTWKDNLPSFMKILLSSLVIAVFLGGLAIIISHFFGEKILGLIYGEDFVYYSDSLVLIMIAGLFLYLSTVLGYTLTSIGFTSKQVYLFSFLLIMSIILCSYYIPAYGMIGAIYYMISIYAIQTLLCLIIIGYSIKLRST